MSDTSPLAFPLQGQDGPISYGMTIRDWFAGQALTGLTVNRATKDVDLYAKDAYLLADAMLAERQKGNAK